jgi:hypothetical protein
MKYQMGFKEDDQGNCDFAEYRRLANLLFKSVPPQPSSREGRYLYSKILEKRIRRSADD